MTLARLTLARLTLARLTLARLTLARLTLALLAVLIAAGPAVAQDRPRPYPVLQPPQFERAIAQGTRTAYGAPGPNYWQNRATYDIDVTIDPATRSLSAVQRATYFNNSPDSLAYLVMKVRQNLHAPGVPRNRTVEVTGGTTIEALSVDGTAYSATAGRLQAPAYDVSGTLLTIALERPIAPGGRAVVETTYSFPVPSAGGAPRMGQDGEVYFLSYFYPQFAVFDDVYGWHTDPYLGMGEHYMPFADYDVSVTLPEGWLVSATGTLTNASEVLAPRVRERLATAATSDEVVRIVEEAQRLPGESTVMTGGTLTWEYRAQDVRDFAFGASAAYVWDATRANVGDTDADGEDDYALIHALYRPDEQAWRDRAAEFLRFSVEHLSDVFFPYPYPHMSMVEGIIGGGMEYPMITLIGSDRNERSLFGVTYHETSHMWFPMVVGSDEKRYTWMEEGLTSYNTQLGEEAFVARGGFGEQNIDPWARRRQYHYYLAGTGYAVEPMRHADQTRIGGAARAVDPLGSAARTVAAYSTPVVILRTLEGTYGRERFLNAYRSYARDWAFKHPYPWDLFNSFERYLGEDLDWLWTPMLFETWVVDLALGEVETTAAGVTVTVRDLGLAPVPVPVEVTYADGRTHTEVIPVQTWLDGAWETQVTFPAGSVASVVLDPGGYLPDVAPGNNARRLDLEVEAGTNGP
ncbi:MAG: M1 family metallopeptidase [Bacteroidota bacterium]